MKKFFTKKKQKGLTILEALISTAIVGIGFIAVFQLVNFSVGSIDVSGERTKVNYITGMIAEDIIAHRNDIYGIDPSKKEYAIDEFNKPVNQDGTRADVKKFAEHLMAQEWSSSNAGEAPVCKRGREIAADEFGWEFEVDDV